MGRRGPKPAPTSIKILTGVRADRINHHEPRILAEAPDKPAFVEDEPEASALWDELAPQLVSLRVLSNLDRTALAMLCIAYAQWREAPFDVQARTHLRRMLAEFGLTPSSRSTLKVTAAVGPADALGDFLRGKN